MKVRLVDVDGKMPNLALMRASAYHKKRGDDTGFYDPIFDCNDTDLIYASKLFNFSDDYDYFPANTKTIKGGTGYDIESKLPKKVEVIRELDYSIYPNCDYSLQFFSRGCIRSCPFCVVREKEGCIKSVEPFNLNQKGKHIEIMDNNFFANPDWEKAIAKLSEWNQPVNFHGVDARIMTGKQADAINKLKHKSQIHIAWDDPKQDLVPKLKQITKYIKPYKLMCYVLIGYWSSKEEDLYRIEKLRELKIDPFVMAYDKSNLYQKRFARWVNHKAVWRTVKWEDYR